MFIEEKNMLDVIQFLDRVTDKRIRFEAKEKARKRAAYERMRKETRLYEKKSYFYEKTLEVLMKLGVARRDANINERRALLYELGVISSQAALYANNDIRETLTELQTALLAHDVNWVFEVGNRLHSQMMADLDEHNL